jgi:signal transduction histidine kinase
MVYAVMTENNERLLQEQGKKIDDLFRVLFHDLANSLGRLSIGLSIARRQENSPQTNRGIEISSEASASMIEITQNVRRMYAVSKGKGELDLQLTPLNPAVDYLRQIFQDDLRKKGLTLEYDARKHDELYLEVEPVSFKNQVLGNILANAIKFSHPGGKIFISAYPLNHHYVAVEVRDEGIGMPPELVEQIFDLSKKTSRSGTGGEVGTGFGLHIMKSFVEMYHGEVVVSSVEARGQGRGSTTFTLKLRGCWK